MNKWPFALISAALCVVSTHAASAENTAQCVAIASHRYDVPEPAILRVIEHNRKNPSGIGVMGVPTAWMPYLANYNIDASEIAKPCPNIIAGTWIMAYSNQVEHSIKRLESLYQQDKNLPKQAREWQPIIRHYAKESGVPAKLINAVIMQESGFNQSARSKAGAIGLMQLMPATAQDIGVNPYDGIDNLRGGIAYLRDQLSQFSGNIPLALAAYNAGPKAVTRYGGVPPFSETQNYVDSILSMYNGQKKSPD